MRESEFWQLVDDEFGRAYGRTVVRDLVLTDLAGRTAEQALAAGEPVRDVWFALAAALDVPESRRWGRDPQARRR